MGPRFLEHLRLLHHKPKENRDWFCCKLGCWNSNFPKLRFSVYQRSLNACTKEATLSDTNMSLTDPKFTMSLGVSLSTA